MSKYTKAILKEAVSKCTSVMGVLRYLGLRESGGMHSYIKTQIDRHSIATPHFTGQAWNKGKVSNARKGASEILVKRTRKERAHLLRRALLELGRPYECGVCKQGSLWNGKKLVLEVDHIDGNSHDHRPENLRFICPNCHSQTKTYAGRNKKCPNGGTARHTRLRSERE